MQPVSDAPQKGVVVRHHVPEFSERWLLHEGMVPEAAWHSRAVDALFAALTAWLARVRVDAAVYRNLAVRVREDRPSVGFDPDVCFVVPAPPEAAELDSLQLWLPGHEVPRLAFELVSKHHPTKDYVEIPDKCAAAGVEELVVFDPKRYGPKAHGGPQLLQIWRRADDGAFERVYAGDGPAHCRTLDAWLLPFADTKLLSLSDDRDGTSLWLTTEQTERAGKEAERAAKEAERAAKEAERAAKEAALERIAELEAQLSRR